MATSSKHHTPQQRAKAHQKCESTPKTPFLSLPREKPFFSLAYISIYPPPLHRPYRLTASRLQIPTITQTISTYRQHRPYRLTTQGLHMPTITQTISIFHPPLHTPTITQTISIFHPPLHTPTITQTISIFQFTFASTYPVLRFSTHHYTDHINLPPRDCKCLPLHTPYRFPSSLSPLHIQCFDFPVHFRLYISSASIFQFTFASTYPVLRFSSSLSPLHIQCFDSTSDRIKSIV